MDQLYRGVPQLRAYHPDKGEQYEEFIYNSGLLKGAEFFFAKLTGVTIDRQSESG